MKKNQPLKTTPPIGLYRRKSRYRYWLKATEKLKAAMPEKPGPKETLYVRDASEPERRILAAIKSAKEVNRSV